MTWDSAPQYPSGVYASSKSCWTSSTSATFFAANSSASPATPLPITNPLTVLEVSFAICCAAASVSKLVLFHLPWRCSAMTKTFISNHPCFKLQLLHQFCGYFLGRTRQEFRLLRLRGHVDFYHALCRLDGNSERFARDGRDFFFLRGHDALQRGVAYFVNSRLNGEHSRQRAFDMLKPAGLEFALELHFSIGHFNGHDDGGMRPIQQCGERFLDRLLYALWSQGKRNHLAAVLFLEPQRFFECVTVRLVHLKADVGFANPVSGDGQRGVFGGNLLYAHEDVHGSRP